MKIAVKSFEQWKGSRGGDCIILYSNYQKHAVAFIIVGNIVWLIDIFVFSNFGYQIAFFNCLKSVKLMKTIFACIIMGVLTLKNQSIP